MKPDQFLAGIIDPGLDLLASLGGPPPTDPARRLLLAIALQESDLRARYQHSPAVTPGPARGFWQFEQGGGAWGVLNHAATKILAHRVCETCHVIAHQNAVWRALEGHDDLAVCFARLLLWSDPRPLSTTQDASWDYYLRNWRPGKPSQHRWPERWQQAERAVRDSAVIA